MAIRESPMRRGAFGWTEPMTADVAAARAFCGALFGGETEDYPGGGYVPVKVGGEAVGGRMAAPPERAGMPPVWGVHVTVDDADAVARRAEELGGKVLRPPEDIPLTRVGFFIALLRVQPKVGPEERSVKPAKVLGGPGPWAKVDD